MATLLLCVVMVLAHPGLSMAASSGVAPPPAPPLPVRTLSLGEVARVKDEGSFRVYLHDWYNFLRPGEWRVVGPPFAGDDAALLGRSTDGRAGVMIQDSTCEDPCSSLLRFSIRRVIGAVDSADFAALPDRGAIIVDAHAPIAVSTVRDDPAEVVLLNIVSWRRWRHGFDAIQPLDNCTGASWRCLRTALRCGRRSLVIRAGGYPPLIFDLRARPGTRLVHDRRRCPA